MYGHFRFSDAARAIIVAATAASLAASPVTALACTQVYAGPEVTESGETIYGRSEDAANRREDHNLQLVSAIIGAVVGAVATIIIQWLLGMGH